MTLDTDQMVEAFRHVTGRRLLGVVESTGCVELVFENGESHPCNLVCFNLYETYEKVSFGGVDDPESYAERAR